MQRHAKVWELYPRRRENALLRLRVETRELFELGLSRLNVALEGRCCWCVSFRPAVRVSEFLPN